MVRRPNVSAATRKHNDLNIADEIDVADVHIIYVERELP